VRHAAAGWMRSTGQAEAASLARQAPTHQSADATATASRGHRRRRRREDGGVRWNVTLLYWENVYSLLLHRA
jgi:hypothetical protein